MTTEREGVGEGNEGVDQLGVGARLAVDAPDSLCRFLSFLSTDTLPLVAKSTLQTGNSTA